ncbi:MAG: long-chain fatty acid--CoA ligase [Bacteroidales bacterium]|jgi:long-chain acyl-CoA synthetase|nr:long-chain fatty acid--CoA ligase [Bacteroidales bacterium]
MAERITIIDFVEKYSHKYENHPYLREKVNGNWKVITQGQTREEAYRIGAGLMSLGLKKGDKIALLSESRAMWILAELGALYAGATDVPLSVNLGEGKDLIFRINHSDAKWILVSGNHLPKIRAILSECPNVEKVIVFDDVAFDYDKLEDKEIRMSEIQKMGDEFLKAHKAEFEARYKSIGPDDYANISYTSGTTADPKGILLTHRNYTANVEQGNSVISIDEGNVMLIILPLDHCFAHVAGMYTMMIYGGSIAFVPIGKNAMATLRNIPTAISEVRPHVMLSVPALARNFKKNIETGIKKKGATTEKLFNFAVKNAIKYNKEYYNRGTGGTFWRKPLVDLFDKILFSKVRESFGGRMKFFVGGGALLDIELQRFFCAVGMPMFQGYGLTEATPIICANSTGHARFGSSGRIVKPMDCVILDAEGKEVPHGTRGEIVIRGENVMAGYWKNPKATADTVIDGWLHTGDMGYICPEDPEFLYVVGRFKSLLISSDGEKYSPEGFEDSITETSKWVNACVLHNNQKPFCVALFVPDKAALTEAAQKHGLDPASEEGRNYMLDLIQADVDSYKKGGKHEGMFPERWLPSAIGLCDEEFTIANKMMNSTMKIVRGKVEEHYADLLDYLYTAEGKDIHNVRNHQALKQ